MHTRCSTRKAAMRAVAVLANRPDAAQALIAAGVPLNDADKHGYTPLLYASTVYFGDHRMVDLLLRSGADSKVRTKAGETALSQATRFQYPHIQSALEKPGRGNSARNDLDQKHKPGKQGETQMRLNGFALRTVNGREARNAPARRWGLGVLLGTMAATVLTAAPADWPMFGQNVANTAATDTPGNSMSPKQVAKLKLKWSFTTGGDVSARAAVVGNVAYFPVWGGNLWAVNAINGKLIWSHQLSDYGLPANTHSRTTPAVVKGNADFQGQQTGNNTGDNTLYLGTQEGAWLLAIDAATGALVWKSQLESPAADPFAVITTSPVVANGVVYTGLASTQEAAAGFVPGFHCCSARGSVVAVNATTGTIQWKTYTVPAGYSGGGVWGSNPVVDAARHTVFASTGNNYSHPQSYAVSSNPSLTYGQCITAGGTASSCNSPDDHVDSILALDMSTGAVKWARKLVAWSQYGVQSGSDDWNVACFVPPFTNCPTNPGPDYDFGSAPNEITYQTPGGPKTIIGAGQKSGIYYALDPDTGADLWHTQVGPGSSLGGMEWGSASDGKRIYVALANFFGIPYSTGSAGSWAALDPATGAILWQKADPNGAIDLGPLAVADGVVYAASMAGSATAPTMYALDAADGGTVWSFAAGSSVIAGATIAGETVYWGSGYTHLGIAGYTGNNKFYAFSK